jgi:hypothetical protein
LLGLVVDELRRDRTRPPLLGSVEPVRSRVDGDRGILAVTFDRGCDTGDASYLGFRGLERDSSGWRLFGGGFTTRLGEGPGTSESWFRSGGWGGGYGWVFGGVPADQSVRRVRVDTGGGSSVEDIVDNRVVLLIARDGDLGRATVEMFDARDRLTGSGRLLEPVSRPPRS